MEEDFKIRYLKFLALGAKLGSHDILKSLYSHKASASKWLLGGAIAFIYSIVLSPKEIVETYGNWPPKISIALFSISVFYGVVAIIGSAFESAFSESAVINDLLKKHLELTTPKDKKVEGSKSTMSTDEYLKPLFDDLFTDFKMRLKSSKSLIFQGCFFILALVPLFISFFRYVPQK